MDAFNDLRRQAREKRDKAIHEARDAYAATLTRIAALEQDLLGRDVSSHRTIAACIDSALPTDRTFTTQIGNYGRAGGTCRPIRVRTQFQGGKA